MRKIAFLLASVMIVTAPSMALAAKKKAKKPAAAAAMSEPAPAASMMCCQDTVKMFQVGSDAWKTPAGAPK